MLFELARDHTSHLRSTARRNAPLFHTLKKLASKIVRAFRRWGRTRGQFGALHTRIMRYT